MSSQNMKISLALLQLLSHSRVSNQQAHRLEVINSFITLAQVESRVSTVLLFGKPLDVEMYSPVASDIPKVIISPLDMCFQATRINGSSKVFFIAVGSLRQIRFRDCMEAVVVGKRNELRGLFVVPHRAIRRQSPAEWELTLRHHFDWCWNRGYVNVFVLLEQLKSTARFRVYDYTPYPRLSVNPVSIPAKRFNMDTFRNMHGVAIRTVAKFDPPRVFELPAAEPQYSPTLSGHAVIALQTLLEKHNATLRLVQPYTKNWSHYSALEMTELLKNDEVDISTNLYLPHSPEVRLSYPARMIQWVVLVPLSNEDYFYSNFVEQFLIYIVVGQLYLSVVKYLSEWVRGHFKRKLKPSDHFSELGHSCLEVFRLQVYQPINTNLLRNRLQGHTAFTLLLMMLLGFIYCSAYTAFCASELTMSLSDGKVQTISALIAANESINVFASEIPIMLGNYLSANSSTELKLLGELFLARDDKEMLKELLEFRPGIYAVLMDFAAFILKRQKLYLSRPLLQLMGDRVGSMPIGFMLSKNSPWEHILTDFILWANAAGLNSKWLQDSLALAYPEDTLWRHNEEQKYLLSLKQLHFALTILIVGNICALICFVLENLRAVAPHLWYGLKK